MEGHGTIDLKDREQNETSRGLRLGDFMKIAPSGFGNPFNAYPHSMAWFKDHLYVGTTKANLASRAKQIASKTPERMGKLWPVRIPKGSFDNDLRAEIWRYEPRAGKWEKVYVSPMVIGIDGFEVPLSVGFRCMTQFQGPGDSAPALYVPTWGSHQTPATRLMRTTDGVAFEEVSEPGLGVPDPKPRGLRGFVPFKGHLFAASVVGQERLEPNIAGFMMIYASSDPAGGEWVNACEPHFGNPNNVSIFDMAEFNGHLYAGTLNINEGFEIWKTDAEGKPPFTWKKVLSGGAYRGKLNQMAMTLTPFRDHLYIGSAVQNCSFDFNNRVGPIPPEVLRIGAGDSWDIVVGDPRITPDGLKVPISGLNSGFGNPFSGYIWSMCEHDGWLYVATAVWAVFLRYSGNEGRWPRPLRSIFEKESLERLLTRFGGCDLWRTRDGTHWVPVTQNGFDNCFNIGFRNMVSSPFGLFVGGANPFTPDVAVDRVAGWTYERNLRGGLEIWHGSTREPANVDTPAVNLRKEYSHEGRAGGVEVLIRDFYGGSGFRHIGFWREDIKSAKSACENLMDEILAFLPEKNGTIMDIGCGHGESTRYLLKHYPPEAITGVMTEKDLLEVCKTGAQGINFIYSGPRELDLLSKSTDVIVWAKSTAKLGSRRNLLRKVFQALRPGGRLVFFDILYGGPELKFEGPAGAEEGYKEMLASAGFAEAAVFDVTEKCLEGFRKHLYKYFVPKVLAGDVSENVFRRIEKHIISEDDPAQVCVLVSACKPHKNHHKKNLSNGVNR